MKKTLLVVALLAVPLAGVAALAQEKKAQPASAPADDPMMAAWQEFMTPGPAHEILGEKVGRWKLDVKMFMAPDAPPTESTATSEMRWILGNRYLEETCKGDFMGMPFEGHGVTGYDNLKKKYFGTWIDNLGTGVLYSEGAYDAATRTFSYSGQGPDVLQGKYVKTRNVEKWVDADHWRMESFSTDANGKEQKSMEILYTRLK